MSKILVCFFILSLTILTNCTVQKRIYNKGWDVQWKPKQNLAITEIYKTEKIEYHSYNNFEEISENNNNSIEDFNENISREIKQLFVLPNRISSHSNVTNINSNHKKIIEAQELVQNSSIKKPPIPRNNRLNGSIVLSVLGALILFIALFILFPAESSLLGILVLFIGLLFLIVGISSIIVELIRFFRGTRKAR